MFEKGDFIFEIVLDDAKLWKKSMDAIVNLVKEGSFEFDKEGIKLMAMDPSQISMLIFNIPSSAFSKYEVSEKAKLGINIEEFSKIMGRMRAKEKMVLKYDGSNKLDVTFIAEKSRRSFKIPIIDVTPGPSKALQIEYNTYVKMKASIFKEILKDVALISPHILLVADVKRFKVEATGDNSGVEIDYEGDVEVKSDSVTHGLFSRDYLDDMTKGSEDDADLTIYLGSPTQTDKRPKPLKLEYNIGPASFIYFLAPRIETD
ncbi:MAG: proliferating cell nuclear antigen (pcna) [Candidatus Micrarchaeia archaeon]